MARKPNYRFERHERERIKAEKKAARAEAKAEKKQGKDEPAEDSAGSNLPGSASAGNPED